VLPLSRGILVLEPVGSSLIGMLGRLEYHMNLWNQYELIEFFGVLPEEDEDHTYLCFSVEKDGIRLEVSFFHYTFDVYIQIYRKGVDDPVFKSSIENSLGMKYMKHANGWECLEIAAPYRNESMEEEWIIPIGARLKVSPHISVEMFQPSAR
jgi:hypothetical protein